MVGKQKRERERERERSWPVLSRKAHGKLRDNSLLELPGLFGTAERGQRIRPLLRVFVP